MGLKYHAACRSTDKEGCINRPTPEGVGWGKALMSHTTFVFVNTSEWTISKEPSEFTLL